MRAAGAPGPCWQPPRDSWPCRCTDQVLICRWNNSTVHPETTLPQAPVSSLASAHQKLCLWETNESPPPERSAAPSCCFSCCGGLAAGRPTGRQGRVTDLQLWHPGTAERFFRSSHPVRFPALPPPACLLVVSLLRSAIIQKQAGDLKGCHPALQRGLEKRTRIIAKLIALDLSQKAEKQSQS